MILTIAILIATAAVIATSRRRRAVGMVLAVPILVRTFALCYATTRCRYTIELIALAIALCLLAGLDAYERIRARRA